MRIRRRAPQLTVLFVVAIVAAIAAVSLGSAGAGASPNPANLTVGVGDAAPSSVSFSGGPITGSTDASGSANPLFCQEPACESFNVTLAAPAGTASKSLAMTATITFDSRSGGAALGVDGLDVYILDSKGAVVSTGGTTGASPNTASASGLDPGKYTIEVTGENAAVQESYKGTLTAAVVPPPSAPPPLPGNTLAFSPPTLVSPVILGAEPQIQFERPVPGAPKKAGLDTNRGYVDWPVSSRVNIGTLWRTTNDGLTFRQLVDLTCAERQRPNCLTGGGGDTVNRVNNFNGTVNFGDQESLAQEAYATSFDHGDSFPPQGQSPVTSPFTGVDRQWIATVDSDKYNADPTGTVPLEAIFSYHLPNAGQIVAGIDANGQERPGVPVLPLVGQSGPSLTDTQPGSPANGWFYQPYRSAMGGAFDIGAAPIGDYQNPSAYKVGHVTKDQPLSFPWVAIDRQGNMYAVWVALADTYMSTSLITDPANNPKAGGAPGSKWSPKVQVNPPGIGSTMFPSIVAGDHGRVAIVYYGTSDYTGKSDYAGPKTRWNVYMAMSNNALDPAPTFQYGLVTHRVAHIGSICTRGTTCAAPIPPDPPGDRSLLDMIQVTTDATGRLQTVFTDNNNQFGIDEASLGSQGDPFVKVATLTSGPSLYADGPASDVTGPNQCETSAPGDANWPNQTGAKNIPALDITGVCASTDGVNLLTRISLTDASKSALAKGLTQYNAVMSSDPPASRLQYVARWEEGNDSFYIAAEAAADGTLTYYGGKLQGSNAVNAASSAVGLAYRAQDKFPVQGHVEGNTLVLSLPLDKVGAAPGDGLFGFQAFSLAGPADTALGGQSSTAQVFASMRNIDAAPAMDVVLGPLPSGAQAGSAITSTNGETSGGVGGLPAGNPQPGGNPGGNPGGKPGGKPGGQPVKKPVVLHTHGCPAAVGRLTQVGIGPIRLGMPRARARRALKRATVAAPPTEDFYCLHGPGIRAGYLDAALLRHLRPALRRAWRGRSVLVLSANRAYTINGIRPGDSLASALRKLRHAHVLLIGRNRWYVARFGRVTGVIRTRHGAVLEVGIMARAVAPTVKAQRALLHGLRA